VAPLRRKHGYKCVKEKRERLQKSDEPSENLLAMAIVLNTFKASVDFIYAALKGAGNH
jgi:hypothetical protein